MSKGCYNLCRCQLCLSGGNNIAKLTWEGDHVYSCFYDFTLAFDTVEYLYFWVILRMQVSQERPGVLLRIGTLTWPPLSGYRLIMTVFQSRCATRATKGCMVTLIALSFHSHGPNLIGTSVEACHAHGLSISGVFFSALSHADDRHSNTVHQSCWL